MRTLGDIPQRGKVVFEGHLATQFWIRALGLQDEIGQAQVLLSQEKRRKEAAVPIVAEYEVDSRLTFVYLIVAKVDMLGIQNGTGVIYFASPHYLKEAKRIRDGFADDIMKDLEKRGFDEIVEIEDKTERKRKD
jgi:hypothetical protein